MSEEDKNDSESLQHTMSTDFAGLRKSVTANFSLLLNKSFSQELPPAAFNDPPIETETNLGKRAALEDATPPKSVKKSKGKSRGNSAKSSKTKGKSKSPLKERDANSNFENTSRELKKQFSFGDLSLALNAIGDKVLSRAPSLADLGFSVKLEGSQELEHKPQPYLRHQTSPKPGKYFGLTAARLNHLKSINR